MTKPSGLEDIKKRERIRWHFWEEVGAVEHISLPELENAVRREFNSRDDRLLREQIELMQTESRIRVQSKVKVWIRSPQTKSNKSS